MVNFAQKYRPKSCKDILSQEHLCGNDGVLKKFINNSYFPNTIFYGPPGCGKTSLARVVAKELNFDYIELNATTIKVENIREVIKQYKNSLIKPLLFIDEIHRLSRNQEEVLLPHMENKDIILIGASTTNPYYSLSSAFRSRSHLFKLNSIKNKDIKEMILKIIDLENIDIDEEAINYIVISSNGDARGALNLLESAYICNEKITTKLLKKIRSEFLREGSSQNDSHYDLTSALIKSIRGSDIDASLYYLARLISQGENPEYIARRLAILASEDIGNANPNALNLAASTITIVSKIGYPEARIPLSQLTVYLASSPKSNSSYQAINYALELIENGEVFDIPNNIKTNSKEYINPHNFGGYIKQKYLKKNIKIYNSKNIGFEKKLDEWIKTIKYRDNL